LKNSSYKTVSQYDRVQRKIKENEFHFASIRAGAIFGEHTIGLDSPADSIILTHSLKNRSGLAIGAIMAAKWIKDKKGFYNFSEIFEEIVL
jgi:4-hydroxy-tetrahydrodipicolinate reductase